MGPMDGRSRVRRIRRWLAVLVAAAGVLLAGCAAELPENEAAKVTAGQGERGGKADQTGQDGQVKQAEPAQRTGTARQEVPLADDPPSGRSAQAAPEKLDERPEAGVTLFLDEGLVLDINGERREVLRPGSIRWAGLHEADVDDDGTAEIVITYSLGGGTGFNDGRMAVFRRDFTAVPSDDDPLEALEGAMAMSMDHKRREIVLEADGRAWRIPFPDDETDWWPAPHIGNVIHYVVVDDRPAASVGLQVSTAWFPADLWIAYDWNGERLAVSAPEVHVHKETGHPYRYEDRRLGLALRVPAGWFVDTGAFGGEPAGGKSFAVLVEGHPERALRHDDRDRITVSAGTGPAPKLKGAWEQIDVKLPSGETAALHFANASETVELWFLSDIAVANGVLWAETFNGNRDAIVEMLGSLETLMEN